MVIKRPSGDQAPRLPKVQEVSPEQGVLITGKVTGGVAHISSVEPEGVFPEDITSSIAGPEKVDLDIFNGFVKGEKERRRRISEANRGKHTVGSHGPFIGDVMSGGEVVTERNYEEVRDRWSREQTEMAKTQPSLFESEIGVAVGGLASALSIDGEKKRKGSPRLSQKERLAVVMEHGVNLRFAPGTATELKDALYFESDPEDAVETTRRQLDKIYWSAYESIGQAGDYKAKLSQWRGLRSVYSKIYEMVDYQQNARHSVTALTELLQQLEGANPETLVNAVVPGNRAADGPLMRDAVLRRLATGLPITEEAKMFGSNIDDALRPVTDRWDTTPRLAAPNLVEKQLSQGLYPYSVEGMHRRHKILHDVFTDPEMKSGRRTALRTVIGSRTVGEVKKFAGLVLEAQTRRDQYWTVRLEAIDTTKYPMPTDGSAEKPKQKR